MEDRVGSSKSLCQDVTSGKTKYKMLHVWDWLSQLLCVAVVWKQQETRRPQTGAEDGFRTLLNPMVVRVGVGFQILILSPRLPKPKIPMSSGGRAGSQLLMPSQNLPKNPNFQCPVGEGGGLLIQLSGGYVGFAKQRRTCFHRSMVSLADTSASGEHKQGIMENKVFNWIGQLSKSSLVFTIFWKKLK